MISKNPIPSEWNINSKDNSPDTTEFRQEWHISEPINMSFRWNSGRQIKPCAINIPLLRSLGVQIIDLF